jgi:hypothetical protein
VLIIAAIGLFVFVRNKSKRLQGKFGPEYNRAVRETGSKSRAEAKLENLEKRVKSFSIHPLPSSDRENLQQAWRAVQARFVDDPKRAVTEADELIGRVMTARGYPVADFDARAEELSVEHPHVVSNYRAGHAIALRHAQGRSSTEDMRQAMIHYRTLFADLVDEKPVAQKPVARSRGAGG